MKPASITQPAPLASIAAISARSKSSRTGYCVRSITAVLSPSSCAAASPAAPARSLITSAICAPIRPARQAWAIASMLLPRPEMSTASCRFRCSPMRSRARVDDYAARSAENLANQYRVLAVRAQQAHGLRGRGGLHNSHHADTTVEGAVHLGRLYGAGALQPFEDRRAR